MATIPYITGFNVKPNSISAIGVVTFTDGTNDIIPNQLQCETYGYTYDKATGTCTTFRYNTNLNRNISNVNNTIRGSQNTTETGVNNTLIMGERNTVRSLSRNNLIVGNQNEISNEVNNSTILGSNNEIASGVNNATVLGSNGIAIRDGEVVISSGDGIAQNTTFFLNGTTGDATSTALFINGNTAVTTIERESDTCYFYSIDINAFRTGGASGTGSVFDRVFFTLRGMINGANLDQTLTSNVIRGASGISWTAGIAVVGTDMRLKVTGAASMDVKWTATANFNSMKV
jgi:hypothetical protein